MSMAIHVGENMYSIGSAKFYDSFFGTVKRCLESGIEGSRYPNVMKMRSSGELEACQADDILRELHEIQEELAKFSPSDYRRRFRRIYSWQ